MSNSKNTLQTNPIRFFLNLNPLARIIFILLVGLNIGLITAIIWYVANRNQVHHLTLVAGNKLGESYILSKAIEQVVESNNSHIQIDVQETGGTGENIKLLAAGKAQLATAQADVPAGSEARTVAVLYQDTFQLLVKNNSPIQRFVDLKGKRLGLPPSGGQFQSFLQVASHYDLKQEDFTFIGTNDQQVTEAFRQNQVDAVFRVRALGNQSISELVQQYQGRLVPIEQAAAMKIKYPAFEPATIPEGAYKGNPPVPDNNLPTVAVERILLANKNVNMQVIREITAILDERRQQIADAIPQELSKVKPLVASISRPTSTGSVSIPIHPGSIAFYERDKPSFIQENADYLGLLLTIILLIWSWLWQLKSWIEQNQKDTADIWIESAIKLMNNDSVDLDTKQHELERIFSQAANDLVEEKISQESFRTFNEAYKTAREVIEQQIKIAYKKVESQQQIAQQEQQDISARYIKSVVDLLAAQNRSKELIQNDLEQVLAQATASLIAKNITQESFRTFMEAYKTTRDAIERKTY